MGGPLYIPGSKHPVIALVGVGQISTVGGTQRIVEIAIRLRDRQHAC